MPFANTRTGARLHYEELGHGEPIILIHGLFGTARYDLGRVMDWLSADYHVLGLTLRGYGESIPKPRDFPPGFYRRDTEDLLAFMDAIGVEQAHILGYSDGGEVALMAPGLQPQRFLSAAAIGAVGYFGTEILPRFETYFPVTWISDEEKALHGYTDVEPMIHQWVDAMTMLIHAGGDLSLSRAKNITCPLLIMLGKDDRLNPRTYGAKFINQTPRGQLAMFNCGHPVHAQRWEEFQQVYGDFLKGID